MKQLNKQEKILTVTTLSLFFLFIFKSLAFDPLRDKINGVRSQIEEAQLLLRKYAEIQRYKDQILASQKQIERYLGLRGTIEEKSAAILTKIEQEARKSGVSVLDMNAANLPSAKSKPEIYRVSLRAEAEPAKLSDFIYNLENSDILLRVEKIALSAKDETSSVLKIDATILGIALS